MVLYEKLIAKLEAAKSVDLNSDADIYEALGYEVKRGRELSGESRRRFTVSWRYLDDTHSANRWCAMRNFTTNTDDACTLIPPGWYLDMHGTGEKMRALVQSHFTNAQEIRKLLRKGLYHYADSGGKWHPMPLAIAIAAMRGRSLIGLRGL